jgi:hypothetical protein
MRTGRRTHLRQGSSFRTAPCRVPHLRQGSSLSHSSVSSCLTSAGLLSLCRSVSGIPPRQGSSRRTAPRRGDRRSTLILQRPDQPQIQTSIGSGAPSPSPAPQKLPECAGTASGGCLVRGAVSRMERSALDQAVKGSALICVQIRRGAFTERSPAAGGRLATQISPCERRPLAPSSLPRPFPKEQDLWGCRRWTRCAEAGSRQESAVDQAVEDRR